MSAMTSLLMLECQQAYGFFSSRAISRPTTFLAFSDNTQPSKKSIGIGIGIDLGTTNSAVAFLDDTVVPQIIEIPNNGRTMKSAVAFDADGSKPLVGNAAIEWERAEHRSAYRHVKRVIGMGSNFISRETVDVVPHLVAVSNDNSRTTTKKKKKKKPTLLRLLEDAKENPTMLHSLTDTGEKVSPEKISSCILSHLLDVATEYTNQSITRAVIGVPAYFNDAQRDATVRAANEAGIEKVKLLREPEAAALAYGIDKDSQEEELVLVFDLGGGTYDVSILLVEEGLTEIVCTSGNSQLGGSNFDAKIAKQLSSLTNGCCRKGACSDLMVRSAEAIRIYLSNNRAVDLALPLSDEGWLALDDAESVIVPKHEEIEVGSSNSTHIFCQLTRKEMERLCIDELQQLLRPIREVAIMAGALLPGDARPSVVESAIEMESAFTDADDFYEDDSDRDFNTKTNGEGIPEELDFKNAKKMQQKGRKKARETAKSEKKFRAESRKVKETQPVDTKIRADGISGRPISRVVLVGGATRMPAIGRLIAALTGVVPQKTVDPDEAVALGCAVHVGVLDGKEEMGTVLNPMQAALLRAVVEKQRRDGKLDDLMFDEEDN
jgi:molecular chaperone DnaK (HSP70)